MKYVGYVIAFVMVLVLQMVVMNLGVLWLLNQPDTISVFAGFCLGGGILFTIAAQVWYGAIRPLIKLLTQKG